jgi:hypothetical protein
MPSCNNCVDLTFIAIGESAEITGTGFGCVGGGELPDDTYGYLSYSFNHSGSAESKSQSRFKCASSQAAGEVGYQWDGSSQSSSKSKGKDKHKITFTPKIDGFGRYIIEEDNTSDKEHEDESDSAYQRVGVVLVSESLGAQIGVAYLTKTIGGTSLGNNTSTRTCIKIPCDYSQCEVGDCGQIECTDTCETQSFSNSYFDISPCTESQMPCSDSDEDEDKNENCNFDIPCGDFTTVNSSCETVSEVCETKSESNESSPGDQDGCPGPSSSSSNSSASSNKTTTVSNAYTVSMAKSFSTASVDTRLILKEINSPTDPCGTICEINSGKDGCWIGSGSTMINVIDTDESPTYYSRAKVKIGLYKKDMDDEDIKSITGTVYFYENNLPSCCCGTGNPIDSKSFSISNSANMKINSGFDEFCSAEIFDKNNDQLQDYAGSSIQACYKINDITYN